MSVRQFRYRPGKFLEAAAAQVMTDSLKENDRIENYKANVVRRPRSHRAVIKPRTRFPPKWYDRHSEQKYSCRKLHIFSVGLRGHFPTACAVCSQQRRCLQPHTLGSTDFFDGGVGARQELILRFTSSFKFFGCSLHHRIRSFIAPDEVSVFFRGERHTAEYVCNEALDGDVCIGHVALPLARPKVFDGFSRSSLLADITTEL